MRRLQTCLIGVLLLSSGVTYQMTAQEQSDGSTTASRTLRPVVRGTQYAVSSMKAEATEAAVRILEAGGNAFDAAVAGQAVLALVNPESNGFGADAVVYVRGRIRHDDHATVLLRDWHRVYLNSEFTTGRVTFYD